MMNDEQCREMCKKSIGRLTMEVHLLQKTVAFLAYRTLPKNVADEFFEAMDRPPSDRLEPELAKYLEEARDSFLRQVAKNRPTGEQDGGESR